MTNPTQPQKPALSTVLWCASLFLLTACAANPQPVASPAASESGAATDGSGTEAPGAEAPADAGAGAPAKELGFNPFPSVPSTADAGTGGE